MESEPLSFEPLDQFVVQPISGWHWHQAALVWLQVSVIVFLLSALCLALMAIPLWRLLPSVGVSKWLALAAAFPPFALVLIWVVAFRTPSTKE